MAAGPPVSREELSIGEFARRSRLPVSTLRYYHELGVLAPARVDRSSGYRYYRPEQLEAAALVSELRRLGMPPAEIAAATGGTVPLVEALATHRHQLAAEIDERADAVRRLDELIAGHGVREGYAVVLESRPHRVVAGLAGTIEGASAGLGIRRLIVRLRARLRTAGRRDPSAYGAMFALDLDTEPVAAVVFAEVASPVPASAMAVDLPGGDHVVTDHRGHGPLTGAYDAVLDWAAGHDRRPSGLVVEEYRVDRVITVAVALAPAVR